MNQNLTQFAGWVTKRGGKWKSWRRRWFILNERRITYHTTEKNDFQNTTNKKGEFSVDGASFCLLNDVEWEMANLFPEDSNEKLIQLITSTRVYYFYPDKREDCGKWLNCLLSNNAILDKTLGNQALDFSLSYVIPEPIAYEIRKKKLKIMNPAKGDPKERLLNDPFCRKIYLGQLKERNPDMNDPSLQSVSRLANTPEKVDIPGNQYEEWFYDNYFNVEAVKKRIFTLDPSTTNQIHNNQDGFVEDHRNSFPIKLYLSEPTEGIGKFVKGVPFGTFAVKHRIVSRFGLIHAALQIGDKVVHFFNNSFVKIDTFKAQNALYLINISKSGRLPLSDKVQHTIAEVIVLFNKHALYDNKYCNCQDFLEYMLDEINTKCKLEASDILSFSFKDNPAIKFFLDNLIEYPDYMRFVFYFDINGRRERHFFLNHEDLDEWEKKQFKLN